MSHSEGEAADAARHHEPASGPVLFARYAFPPNSHGYCGPSDNTGFFEYGVAALPTGGSGRCLRRSPGPGPTSS